MRQTIRVPVLLALLCGCPPYDPGGELHPRIAAALSAQRSDARVEIRGVCNSACALKLASGRGVCIAPDAVIGVHEVRLARRSNYAQGVRDDLFTGYFAAILPRCVDALLASRHAFDSGQLVTFSGQEILTACPQFSLCNG